MTGIIENEGYVYILQNDSHDNLVLKIGLTRGKPEIRAKQLYWGASGVPEHFDIAVAYSVGNCVEAERKIHEQFDTYRVNPNREFFKIDPRVAQLIVLETCAGVNAAMGLGKPIEYRLESKNSKNYIKPVPVIANMEPYTLVTSFAGLHDAKVAPIGTSELSIAQISRIRIVGLILNDVIDTPLEEFIVTFSRDKYPEREIVIWENIAKVYQQFDSEGARTVPEKNSAFKLILSASIFTGQDLDDAIAYCELSYETMLSILNSMRR